MCAIYRLGGAASCPRIGVSAQMNSADSVPNPIALPGLVPSMPGEEVPSVGQHSKRMEADSKARKGVSFDRPRASDCPTEKPGVDPAWEVRSEVLHFQFGPLKLGQVSLRAVTLVSNPFVVDADLAIPIAEAAVQGCRAVVVSAMPVRGRLAAMRFERGALQYAARYGDRYVVDLQGSFSEYLRKFSKKSRGNLQRTAKKFATGSDTVSPIREYRSASEIRVFRDIAVAISRESYKNALGWGFAEEESFARQLEVDAAAGRVRGYVLMSEDQPAAYVFCRIDQNIIIYKHIGYAARFADNSPGTALLYLMLQRLFDEGVFQLLDFDGTEYYAYKKFFATRAIGCARVFWFRPKLPEVVLFGAHWVLMATWRIASLFRNFIWRGRRRWLGARAQLYRTG